MPKKPIVRQKVILALMQNQWFKNPERAKMLMKKYEEHEKGRHVFIQDMLFFGCLTGQRILKAFGEDFARERIIYEEVSKEIGGHSSSVFPADKEHIQEVLEKHKPDILITFGQVATKGVIGLELPTIWIQAPHPASRGADIIQVLKEIAEEVKSHA